jgi:hypothetical protein
MGLQGFDLAEFKTARALPFWLELPDHRAKGILRDRFRRDQSRSGNPMLTVLLFVFFVLGLGHSTTQAHSATDEGPPTLIVQVVDPVFIPLPESKVTVMPASGESSLKSEEVDKNAYAEFWVETGKQYVIEAKSPGFKKKSLKVSIGRPKPATPTAHVQIMLKPNEGLFGK